MQTMMFMALAAFADGVMPLLSCIRPLARPHKMVHHRDTEDTESRFFIWREIPPNEKSTALRARSEAPPLPEAVLF